MASELLGNHSIKQVGPISIGCMDRDARDLMDQAVAGYREETRRSGRAQAVPDFVDWLLERSGLVRGVDKAELLREHAKHMDGIRKNLKDHPNPEFRRRHSRKSVYGLAYWFFRWSGLVDPSGNAVPKVRV